MFETLTVLPISFWVVVLLLVAGGVWAATRVREGIGLPMLAVLGTVAAWYVGDALYNDYANYHVKIFSADVLANAWWQVAWFILVFLWLAPLIHRRLNGRELHQSSQVFQLTQTGAEEPLFQFRLEQLFWGTALVWAVMAGIAAIKLKWELPYYFFPYLDHKADPWGRDRIGTGFDSLLALAGYLQTFVAAMFGLVAALARNGTVRSLALLGCFLVWPYYLFDRTRNVMLSTMLPAILAWVFIRLRNSLFIKVTILVGFFLCTQIWMAFIIANRSDISIVAAVHGEGTSVQTASHEAHQEGLSMFEELCWVNTIITDGSYHPNWGARYFAEIVNPIPRSLWHGKPMIGIDYAIARGMGGAENDSSANVNATFSTGMIGQGVVNFGGVLGPAFAALLMAFWAAVLARQDLHANQLGRLPLYVLGLVLTFNLGRDISLITLYSFVFGAMIVWWLNRKAQREEASAQRRAAAKEQRAGLRRNGSPVPISATDKESRNLK